jgi:hypothetical protein
MKKLLFLAVMIMQAPAVPQSTPVIVQGTVLVDGGAVVPPFTLTFQHRAGSTAVRVAMAGNFGNPFMVLSIAESDTTFSALLQEGDCRVTWANLPANYNVKSISAGSVDLRKSPLTVTRSAIPRIVVILGIAEQRKGSKVSGRVAGLLPEVLAARPPLVLLGQEILLSTRIDTDGFFEFAHVPAGNYAALLARALPVQPSPAMPVVVAGKDVSGVLIAMPPVKEVHGRLSVTGPLPRMAFLVSAPPYRQPFDWSLPKLTKYPVDVMPNGTFKLILPEGVWGISLDSDALPVGYTIQSLKYGSTDLLKTRYVQISGSDAAELHAVVGVTSAAVTLAFPNTPRVIAQPAALNALVSVKGRVTGLLPGNSGYKVFIHAAEQMVWAAGTQGQNRSEEMNRSDTSTAVNADGSFEFPKITQGKYILSAFTEEIPFSVYRPVLVTDHDISDIDILIPRPKIVKGRMYVDGGGRMPRGYGFTLSGAAAEVLVRLRPSCNGSFLATLPEGEYRVSASLPAQYVNTFVYGSTNLLLDSLKVSENDRAELRITLAANTTLGNLVVGERTALGGFNGGFGQDFQFLFGGQAFGPFFSGLDNGPPLLPRGGGLADSIVRGCVAVASEGNSGAPVFSLKFTGASSVEVPVMSDGTFNISLPKGEYRVAPSELPQGYSVKSILADSTDLLRETLKFRDDPPFIMIVLDAP